MISQLQRYTKRLCFSLMILMLTACGDKPCIDADDFGYPKMIIDTAYPLVQPKSGTLENQIVPWEDAALLLTGDRLLIEVDGMWSTWFEGHPMFHPNVGSGQWKCPVDIVNTARQSNCKQIQPVGSKNALGALDGKFVGPCWITDAKGLYLFFAPLINDPGLNTSPEDRFKITNYYNPNATADTMKNPAGPGLHLHKHNPLPGESAAGYSGPPPASGGYSSGPNDRIFAKVVDRHYDDNGGTLLIKFKRGVKPPEPGALESVIYTVKNILNQASEKVYRGIIEQNSDAIQAVRAALVLYLMFYFMFFIFGLVEVKQSDLLIRVIKIAIVIQLISPGSWEFFNEYLFVFFTEGVVQLIGIVTSFVTGGGDGFRILDQMVALMVSGETSMKILSVLIYDFPISLLFIPLVYIVIFIFLFALLKAALLYLLSIIAIAILIIVAPIFIVFWLFKPTKKLFDEWLKQFFIYALQPILLFAALTLVAAIILQQFYDLLGVRICYLTWFDFFGLFEFKWWFPEVDLSQYKKIWVPPFYDFMDNRYLDFPSLDPSDAEKKERILLVSLVESVMSMFSPGSGQTHISFMPIVMLFVVIYLFLKFNEIVPMMAKFLAGGSTLGADLGAATTNAFNVSLGFAGRFARDELFERTAGRSKALRALVGAKAGERASFSNVKKAMQDRIGGAISDKTTAFKDKVTFGGYSVYKDDMMKRSLERKELSRTIGRGIAKYSGGMVGTSLMRKGAMAKDSFMKKGGLLSPPKDELMKSTLRTSYEIANDSNFKFNREGLANNVLTEGLVGRLNAISHLHSHDADSLMSAAKMAAAQYGVQISDEAGMRARIQDIIDRGGNAAEVESEIRALLRKEMTGDDMNRDLVDVNRAVNYHDKHIHDIEPLSTEMYNEIYGETVTYFHPNDSHGVALALAEKMQELEEIEMTEAEIQMLEDIIDTAHGSKHQANDGVVEYMEMMKELSKPENQLHRSAANTRFEELHTQQEQLRTTTTPPPPTDTSTTPPDSGPMVPPPPPPPPPGGPQGTTFTDTDSGVVTGTVEPVGLEAKLQQKVVEHEARVAEKDAAYNQSANIFMGMARQEKDEATQAMQKAMEEEVYADFMEGMHGLFAAKHQDKSWGQDLAPVLEELDTNTKDAIKNAFPEHVTTSEDVSDVERYGEAVIQKVTFADQWERAQKTAMTQAMDARDSNYIEQEMLTKELALETYNPELGEANIDHITFDRAQDAHRLLQQQAGMLSYEEQQQLLVDFALGKIDPNTGVSVDTPIPIIPEEKAASLGTMQTEAHELFEQSVDKAAIDQKKAELEKRKEEIDARTEADLATVYTHHHSFRDARTQADKEIVLAKQAESWNTVMTHGKTGGAVSVAIEADPFVMPNELRTNKSFGQDEKPAYLTQAFVDNTSSLGDTHSDFLRYVASTTVRYEEGMHIPVGYEVGDIRAGLQEELEGYVAQMAEVAQNTDNLELDAETQAEMVDVILETYDHIDTDASRTYEVKAAMENAIYSYVSEKALAQHDALLDQAYNNELLKDITIQDNTDPVALTSDVTDSIADAIETVTTQETSTLTEDEIRDLDNIQNKIATGDNLTQHDLTVIASIPTADTNVNSIDDPVFSQAMAQAKQTVVERNERAAGLAAFTPSLSRKDQERIVIRANQQEKLRVAREGEARRRNITAGVTPEEAGISRQDKLAAQKEQAILEARDKKKEEKESARERRIKERVREKLEAQKKDKRMKQEAALTGQINNLKSQLANMEGKAELDEILRVKQRLEALQNSLKNLGND